MSRGFRHSGHSHRELLRAIFVLEELRTAEAIEAGSDVELASIFGEGVEAGGVGGGFISLFGKFEPFKGGDEP